MPIFLKQQYGLRTETHTSPKSAIVDSGVSAAVASKAKSLHPTASVVNEFPEFLRRCVGMDSPTMTATKEIHEPARRGYDNDHAQYIWKSCDRTVSRALAACLSLFLAIAEMEWVFASVGYRSSKVRLMFRNLLEGHESPSWVIVCSIFLRCKS